MKFSKRIPIAMRLVFLILTVGALAGCAGKAAAGEPQGAMRAHISANTDSRGYAIFDGTNGKLMRLKFTKLHTTVKNKGDYHVSCADFQDAQGNSYDVDFVSAKTGNGYRVVEAWLHKKNGKKRPYTVAHR